MFRLLFFGLKLGKKLAIFRLGIRSLVKSLIKSFDEQEKKCIMIHDVLLSCSKEFRRSEIEFIMQYNVHCTVHGSWDGCQGYLASSIHDITCTQLVLRDILFYDG